MLVTIGLLCEDNGPANEGGGVLNRELYDENFASLLSLDMAS